MHEPAGQSPVVSNSVPALANGPTAVSERILLLEIRMEKFSSALADARADADRLRGRLAEAAAREADHARRYSSVHQELADARAEIVSLHEHLSRSEALRARLEGHLFEAGAGTDGAELVTLRQELAVERERAQAHEQSAARLRRRVDELLMTRDSLLSRMAEWQRLVQAGNPEAIDLAEFIALLRQDIMALENRSAESERQEIVLRELLARAGVNPGAAPAVDAVTEPEPPAQIQLSTPTEKPSEQEPTHAQSEALTFEGFLDIARHPDHELSDLWDSDREPIEVNAPVDAAAHAWSEIDDTLVAVAEAEHAVDRAPVVAMASAEHASALESMARAPVEGFSAADPVVRAASYGRLSRHLENRPSQLADQLRSGLADVDPRVRRRAVLAAATAHNVELRPLLEPLRSDPDPQVRRVVREVLRHAPATELPVHDSAE
jgi:predicted  nucleic acid-binding Zn-ribbon protein